MKKKWVLYCLRCSDGSIYTGVTTDIDRRLREHNGEIAGGSKYTQSRRPCVVAATWPFDSRADAQRAEAGFKKLKRAEKIARIEKDE